MDFFSYAICACVLPIKSIVAQFALAFYQLKVLLHNLRLRFKFFYLRPHALLLKYEHDLK